MTPVQRFKEWRRSRIRAKIDNITAQIEHISDEIPRYGRDPVLDVNAPRRLALEDKRVALWWKRNDLYAKLLKETR